MTRRFLLESFDTAETAEAQEEDVLSQEKWLEAFEKGYKDGWDDAERTLVQRQGQISDALAQNLMDLSFTLNEARVSVRKDLSALLRGVLTSLLPPALEHMLGPQIIAELDALAAETAASTDFEVVVASEQKTAVARALSGARIEPARIVGCPDQKRDTALIRLGAEEREIDLAAALSEIAGMIETYFDEHEKVEEKAYG